LVGVVIVIVGAVRFAPVGMVQRKSFNVVTPPLEEDQLDPVATARKSVELAVTEALEIDQESVPLATA
jgi:hypothetical protein